MQQKQAYAMNSYFSVVFNGNFQLYSLKKNLKFPQNIDCGYSSELNEYPQLVLCRLIEIIDNYRNLASIGSYRLEFSTID